MSTLNTFESVEEVMNAVSELRDQLALRGARSSADRLREALETFYTTASEALGEIQQALESTRRDWSTRLPAEYQKLGDHVVREAKRLNRMS